MGPSDGAPSTPTPQPDDAGPPRGLLSRPPARSRLEHGPERRLGLRIARSRQMGGFLRRVAGLHRQSHGLDQSPAVQQFEAPIAVSVTPSGRPRTISQAIDRRIQLRR